MESHKVVELIPIIGGRAENISAYNYVASLNHKDLHICSAVILDKDWLLTAAHCVVRYRRKKLKVVAGVTDLLHPTIGTKQETNVVKIVIHENYGLKNQSSVLNNVALIKVQVSLNISTYVGKAKISNIQDEQINRYFLSCRVLGWGSRREVNKDEIDFALEPRKFNNLISVELYLLPDALCQKVFSIQKAENFLCIGTLDNFYLKCPSDAGSPVICMNMVVGIPSHTTDLCQVILVTRTDLYSNWINNKIKLHNVSKSYNGREKHITKSCQAYFKLKEYFLHVIVNCFLLHFLY
ncbi:hypothetical protein ILUMI_00749 [Ignelater luminosus]|uniref:Peptidase S1 domain-containing protein n=1 Tax=Ignelater luminosus TaxID=2038154 RepID=A0A8K0DFV0_IGNLU|nr:hypothetical protein ILUMI_00749 [Ignelater luminosus]